MLPEYEDSSCLCVNFDLDSPSLGRKKKQMRTRVDSPPPIPAPSSVKAIRDRHPVDSQFRRAERNGQDGIAANLSPFPARRQNRCGNWFCDTASAHHGQRRCVCHAIVERQRQGIDIFDLRRSRFWKAHRIGAERNVWNSHGKGPALNGQFRLRRAVRIVNAKLDGRVRCRPPER